MSWPDLQAGANTILLNTFGIAATLTPADASPDVAITGIIKNPGVEEEVIPSTGAAAVRFWVDYANIARQPVIGDTLTINGTAYTVGGVDVDVEGGAVLKLRKNA